MCLYLLCATATRLQRRSAAQRRALHRPWFPQCQLGQSAALPPSPPAQRTANACRAPFYSSCLLLSVYCVSLCKILLLFISVVCVYVKDHCPADTTTKKPHQGCCNRNAQINDCYICFYKPSPFFCFLLNQ